MSYVMSEEDKKWQRRSDAECLARAEAIKSDKERYAGAIKGAKEIASERIREVEGIAKVAGMKTPTAPKTTEPITKGNSIPTKTANFDKRGYRNPATLGRL